MLRRQDGQAALELVGVLPALLLAGLIAWQLVLVGHAAWRAAGAARVAARAGLVGEDSRAAAASALPQALERGLEVARGSGGRTTVTVAVPMLHRASRQPVRVGAAASLEAVR